MPSVSYEYHGPTSIEAPIRVSGMTCEQETYSNLNYTPERSWDIVIVMTEIA
jgi:hypothetical protein